MRNQKKIFFVMVAKRNGETLIGEIDGMTTNVKITNE